MTIDEAKREEARAAFLCDVVLDIVRDARAAGRRSTHEEIMQMGRISREAVQARQAVDTWRLGFDLGYGFASVLMRSA